MTVSVSRPAAFFVAAALAASLMFSCGTEKRVVRDYPPAAINPGNFTNYVLALNPYEFQVLVISNHNEPLEDTRPGWWKDAVVYQVYVRDFFDSDGNGTGDLAGLAQKLDYITNIGFGAIWTLPVFSAYHDGSGGRALGYEAIDYYQIDRDYGTRADFDGYTKAARDRGVKVILDMVVNHTARNNPWFIASEKKDQKYKDYYVWTNASIDEMGQAGWKLPWGGGKVQDVWHYDEVRKENFYATWGGELNFKSAAVRKEVCDIAAYWLTNGADGYRLDAIRYLIEEGPYPLQADTASTLAFLKEYQSVIRKASPGAMTVGEVWTDEKTVAGYFQNGLGLDSCFDFDMQGAFKKSLSTESSIPIRRSLQNRPPVPLNFFSTFLDNHDMQRLIPVQSGNTARPKLYAAILLTFSGTPYVYYGDEIGMTGQQAPMQWNDGPNAGFSSAKPWSGPILSNFYKNPRNVAWQLSDPDSLLNLYKGLIRFRNNNAALRRGSLRMVGSDQQAVLAYLRPGPDCTVLFVANLGRSPLTNSLNFDGTGLDREKTYPLTLVPFIRENRY